MTVDALEYLRSQDPAPHGGAAPPMESVLARIGAAETRRPRRRLPLVPVIAVATTLAVLTIVVVLAFSRSELSSDVGARSDIGATPTRPKIFATYGWR